MVENYIIKMNLTLHLVCLCSIMNSFCIASMLENGQISESNTGYINKLMQIVTNLEQKLSQQETTNIKQSKLIKHLEQKLETATTELDNLKERSVEVSRRNSNPSIDRYARQAPLVAFTAYLGHQLYHLGIDHPLIYDKVILNEGGAYNSHTGVFTCPFTGVYSFNFMVASNGTGEQIVAKMVVDGVNMVDGISDTYHTLQEAQGGNSAILSLNKGQTVWISNYRWADKDAFSNGKYRYSTFSGYLAFYR